MLQTRVKFLLIVLGFFHLSYGHIFNVNYSYTYPVNKTLYSSVFLQQNQKSFRLLAGAPKNDRISICNATECQSFSYKVPNEAGFEMLGATISAGNTVGDATYICAPRYIVVLPNFRVNGRCFALHENFTAIHSLNNPYQQVKLYNGSYEFYHAHGQVGFSAKYIDNSEFLLGAPGVLSWKGTVIKHTDFNTKDILNAEKIVDRNSYLGYAIEFGEFNFGGRKRRCAIGGAPRGDTLLGQVFIFDYNDIQEIPLKILKGQQMGAYYGSSLLVAMQYLFVGAPMHNTKAYEEGCVFIYRNDKDDLLLWQTICGQDKGGRFGTAMTSFGRIDNYVQPIGVVISAPYSDDGAGIIYIYEENDAGFKELQQIYGKTISSDIIGFGMSLSNGIDIDDNGYNDFAVGSSASNQLVILRSRKVLKFYGYFQSFVDKISTTTKDIIVTYCYFYAGRLGELAYVNTSITMESDARVIIAMPSRNATIRIGKNTCVNFTLTIKPHAFDSPLPLKLKITNKLEECPECPIAHPKPHSSTLTIPFITGCGTDNICVTDLKLQAQFDDATELIIGTRDDLPFTVLVSNLGETAYSTKMYLTVSTEIRQFPPACSKTLNTLQCDISNRFIANQTKKLEFQLDVKRLDPRMQEIRIDINVSSSSSGNSTNRTITLPVALRSNLTFIGFANPEYVESRDSVNFTHEYVVFNSGPSPLLDERFRFEIPENVVNNHGGNITPFIITPLADECIPDSELPSRTPRDTSNLEQTLSGFPSEIKHNIGCRQNRLMNCKTYTCMIGELIANTSMKFRFKVEVKSSLLFDALGEEVETKSLFIVESLGATTDGNNKDKDQEVLVRTVLFRKTVESMQSLWIWIVVAVISSIIILLIIIVILYKLQFFARPMREKLLNEEEHHHERDCMIVNDDSHCDSSNSQDESPNSLCEESTSEPFKDIKF